MSRIRSIKPELGHHDLLSALHPEIHLYAALLPTYADDEGYFRANPKLVQAAVTPLRELVVSIPEILGKLVETGYLELLTGTDGREYGRIVNFSEHQRVAHPSPSKIKPLIAAKTTPPEILVNPPETGRPDLGIDLGTRNMEGEGNSEGQSIDGQVHEIASLHPKILDAFHLTHEVATAIAEAIARDGRDLVWAGTKSMADVVAKWPKEEMQFLPSAQRYFRESQYRKDPREWERSNHGKSKSTNALRGSESIDYAKGADVVFEG